MTLFLAVYNRRPLDVADACAAAGHQVFPPMTTCVCGGPACEWETTAEWCERFRHPREVVSSDTCICGVKRYEFPTSSRAAQWSRAWLRG